VVIKEASVIFIYIYIYICIYIDMYINIYILLGWGGYKRGFCYLLFLFNHLLRAREFGIGYIYETYLTGCVVEHRSHPVLSKVRICISYIYACVHE
jgi:hypothetical protein